jgi:hypothetical protein
MTFLSDYNSDVHYESAQFLSELKIDGDTIDRTADLVFIDSLIPWDHGGITELVFHRKKRSFSSSITDQWLNKEVELWMNGSLVFKGDIVSRTIAKRETSFLSFTYRCEGLRARLERFPITDSQTKGDSVRYNLTPDDPGYVASRTGRTVGQVIVAVFAMSENAAAVSAAGCGNLAPGSGASASCTIANGSISGSPTIIDGGSGYSSSNPPSVVFVGGSGTGAAGTPLINGSGVITGISMTNAGSGYLYPPQIVISNLPTVTVTDFLALDMTPPNTPIEVRGERFFQAIETLVKTYYRNHYVYILPDGTIRCRKATDFTKKTLTFGIDPIDTSDFQVLEDLTHCYTRIKARSSSFVRGVEIKLSDGSLEEAFDHDGMTNEQAKAVWTPSDWEQPELAPGTATAVAVLAGTTIDHLTIDSGGAGYTSAPTLTISGGGGSGATATATVSGGRVTGYTLTNAGSGYTSVPEVIVTGGGGSGARLTAYLSATSVNNLDIHYSGYGYSIAPAIYIDQPESGTQATATAALGSGSDSDKVTSTTMGTGGSGYTSVPLVRIDGPVPSTVVRGVIASAPDTTHVVLDPDNATMAWAANAWDQSQTGRHGVIILSQNAGTGITARMTRRVTANAALTPGGTCQVTLDYPIDNLNVDHFTLYGLATSNTYTWRRYKPHDSGIRSSMCNEVMSIPYPFTSSDGLSGSLTYTKSAQILYSSNGIPPYASVPLGFDIDPDSGYIYFWAPTVTMFGTPSMLSNGGADIDGIPNDIVVVVPIYDSSLTAVYPDDVSGNPQYSGTGYTQYGIQRTLTLTFPEWKDPSQSSQMLKYITEMNDAVSDVVYEFSITYLGYYEDAVTPGISLGIAEDGADTGMEDWEIPVVRVEINWPQDGETNVVTHLTCSNRRDGMNGTLVLPPPREPSNSHSGEDILTTFGVFGSTEGYVRAWQDMQAAQDAAMEYQSDGSA